MNAADYQKKVDELIVEAFYQGWYTKSVDDDGQSRTKEQVNRLRAELLAAYVDKCRTCGLALSHGMAPVEGLE